MRAGSHAIQKMSRGLNRLQDAELGILREGGHMIYDEQEGRCVGNVQVLVTINTNLPSDPVATPVQRNRENAMEAGDFASGKV